MARPYSAQFMIGRGGNRHETFTVPEGKRAVVRAINLLCWNGAGASVFVHVHGIPVYYWTPPGSSVARFEEVRVVAYARQTIVCTVVGSDWSYGISGFIFADPDGTPDDSDNVIAPNKSLALPAPMPAGA